MSKTTNITDWDDAYDNMGHIPSASSYPDMWRTQAALFRSKTPHAHLDQPYDSQDRTRMDTFFAQGPKRGTVVFVHGGYWMKFDKFYWSHLASEMTQLGFDVVIPSYPLAPHVHLTQMTQCIASAIKTSAQIDLLPLHLVGHSAGGHMISRVMCTDTLLPSSVHSRIQNVVSISGLHDLRPLLHTRLNATIGLDQEEATDQSPAVQTPLPHIRFTAWVGALERPEFIRQSQLIVEAWSPHLDACQLHMASDVHHFTVLDALNDPNSPLVRRLLT